MEIKGTIDYTLTIGADGDTIIEYTKTIENELACLSISQSVIGAYTEYLNEQRKETSGRAKKANTNLLNSLQATKIGLVDLMNFLTSNYWGYKEHIASADSKVEITEEDKRMVDEVVKKVIADKLTK